MQVFDRRLEQLFGPSGEDMDLASRFTVDANGLGMFLSVYSGARSRGNVRAAGNQRVGIEVMVGTIATNLNAIEAHISQANFMRAFGVEKSFVKDMVES